MQSTTEKQMMIVKFERHGHRRDTPTRLHDLLQVRAHLLRVRLARAQRGQLGFGGLPLVRDLGDLGLLVLEVRLEPVAG